MIYTSLNKIKAHHPCKKGWEKLMSNLGKIKPDDDPISLGTILDSNGINDAIWVLRAVEGKDKEIRLFAVACARRVQHLMTDKRSINALDVAEKYANGECSKEELDAARDAALAAALAVTWAAGAAAWWSAAANASCAAGAAAWWSAEAAEAAARSAARSAAAWCAAGAAGAAAAEAEIEWQKQEFIRVFCSEES